MKKLLVLVALVATAVSTNAASFSWKAASGRLFDGKGSESANRYAGTGYLFNAETVSQAALIEAFASADGVSSTTLDSALSTGTFSSGRVSTAVSFTGPDSDITAYFAVFGTDASGNKAIYVSDTAIGSYVAVGEGVVAFGQQNALSSIGFKDASIGYTSAGWYTNVPEPTSGLLMLLGFCGLALRRRRA